MKRGISVGVVLILFVCCFLIFIGSVRDSSAADREGVEDFVTRFYQLCLDRKPDSAGLNGWVASLLDGSLTGSDVAYGFVFSSEFINKNTTNEEYLMVLYKAFFDREPDSAGWQGWMDALNRGTSREDVLKGFIFATEFAQLCDAYGILAFKPTPEPRELVENFVTRFYQLCLDRDPDPAGLNGWVTALLDGSQTGSDVAYGFVFSREFIDKNTTNEEYLRILYEAFFDRQPDSAGWQGWMDALNSRSSREDVLNGFIFATEFFELCDEYGILPYDPLKRDDDGDGFSEFQGDCNDSDQTIYPGAAEVCGDGIDQDCDGSDLPCPLCTNIAGNWSASETVTITCCLDGYCETDSFSGTDTVTIQQNGCNISYDIEVSGYGTFARSGTINANQIQLSGLFAILHPSCTATQNRADISGTVNGDQINLKGSGKIDGICEGDRFSCTGNSTATLTRLSYSAASDVIIGKESTRESSTTLLNDCFKIFTVIDH